MLKIDVVIQEGYDDETSKFIPMTTTRVELEHSLFTLSKWEKIWEKSFLGHDDKTPEETLSYIKLMVLGDELPPEVFHQLVIGHLGKIKEYINAKQTATTITSNHGDTKPREKITAELIYYWMFSAGMPMDCQHWHLNTLITQIQVFSAKNTKPKPMTMAERRQLNERRLAEWNTKG